TEQRRSRSSEKGGTGPRRARPERSEEDEMAYTQEGIMAQIMVAFGQGTGATRVSQEAAMQLRRLYYGAITDDITRIWGTEAVQVLERVRTIGKLAAHRAMSTGATAIGVDD